MYIYILKQQKKTAKRSKSDPESKQVRHKLHTTHKMNSKHENLKLAIYRMRSPILMILLNLFRNSIALHFFCFVNFRLFFFLRLKQTTVLSQAQYLFGVNEFCVNLFFTRIGIIECEMFVFGSYVAFNMYNSHLIPRNLFCLSFYLSFFCLFRFWAVMLSA